MEENTKTKTMVTYGVAVVVVIFLIYGVMTQWSFLSKSKITQPVVSPEVPKSRRATPNEENLASNLKEIYADKLILGKDIKDLISKGYNMEQNDGSVAPLVSVIYTTSTSLDDLSKLYRDRLKIEGYTIMFDKIDEDNTTSVIRSIVANKGTLEVRVALEHITVTISKVRLIYEKR